MPVETLLASLRAQGIVDERVLSAMAEVNREYFVPGQEADAWEDIPLPIGSGQTISQPFVVAYMTQALRLKGTERVLEIGTGSGYQTAILARLAASVYSLEIIPELLAMARRRFAEMRLRNVEARLGDGFHGWPEAEPFDAILGAAATELVPAPLLSQLARGGRIILPVGSREGQQLYLVRKDVDGTLQVESTLSVRFVPMTGEAQRG